MTKWLDVYYNTHNMPSGLEVRTANRKQTPNTDSVSAMLQWAKHKHDGQARLKWGRERQMYRRMDRDRNRQTRWAWNLMGVSIFVCQPVFCTVVGNHLNVHFLHISNMAPFIVCEKMRKMTGSFGDKSVFIML